MAYRTILPTVSWAFLKARLRELGLADTDGGIYRTKAECLRRVL